MSYFGTFCVLAGYFLVVNKRLSGYVLSSIGCTVYIILYAGIDWAIVITNIVFLMINAYGFLPSNFKGSVRN
jgi:hypothetical protein